MLVILRENVENLGNIGDVLKVSDGYARNFLLPRNLVVSADESNVAAVEHHKKMLEKKRLADRASAQGVADRLQEFSCTISRKVGDQDKLFGSVNTSDIADALKAAGFKLQKRAIQLASPLKTLGVHTVPVRLQSDVTAVLKVWIVKE